MSTPPTAEHRRLAESESRRADWKHWGPYVSERAWGSVREDYSASGDAWGFFPHDHARSRAYRWNEDGLGGFCNRFQNLCMAVALWNERDPILKERLFGLTGPEGNHGEDVKEYHYYLDATPTHSYMKLLYKYPQVEYPYTLLVEENQRRDRSVREFELFDALGDAFRAGLYFDVLVEYAKAGQEDILCRITSINRGPEPAPLHVLPHLWYRNTWSWGYHPRRYELYTLDETTVHAEHRHLGERWWHLERSAGPPNLLFTENETNRERLFAVPNEHPYVKDGIDEAVVRCRSDRVNPRRRGTKAAAHYRATIGAGEAFTVRFRFGDARLADPFADFDAIVARRKAEADEFYDAIHAPDLGEDERLVSRQAMAGLLWSKQCYHYSVELWLKGDPACPPPPPDHANGRNANWGHLYALDVLTMPDKWEYPWFAAWDLAFHCITLALVDPEWAKRQLVLLLREWYMHPNGQLAAYEWNFSDVNPPVHAWAARRVYEITREMTGRADVEFLEEVFHKLLLNFTWWVNRKDAEGRNAFQGGFLGLDNIGIFDRQRPATGRWIAAGAGRRHGMDGTILPRHAGHRSGTFTHSSRLRVDGDEVLRALHRDRACAQRDRRRGRDVGPERWFLLRRDPVVRRSAAARARPVVRGPGPPLRHAGAGGGRAPAAAPVLEPRPVVFQVSSHARQQRLPADRARSRRLSPAVDRRSGEAGDHPGPDARPERVPLRLRPAFAFEVARGRSCHLPWQLHRL